MIGLTLVANHKNGYRITGDEITVRLFMLESIHTFYTNRYSQYYVMNFIKALFDDHFSPLKSNEINKILFDFFP